MQNNKCIIKYRKLRRLKCHLSVTCHRYAVHLQFRKSKLKRETTLHLTALHTLYKKTKELILKGKISPNLEITVVY